MSMLTMVSVHSSLIALTYKMHACKKMVTCSSIVVADVQIAAGKAGHYSFLKIRHDHLVCFLLERKLHLRKIHLQEKFMLFILFLLFVFLVMV